MVVVRLEVKLNSVFLELCRYLGIVLSSFNPPKFLALYFSRCQWTHLSVCYCCLAVGNKSFTHAPIRSAFQSSHLRISPSTPTFSFVPLPQYFRLKVSHPRKDFCAAPLRTRGTSFSRTWGVDWLPVPEGMARKLIQIKLE